YYQGPAHGHADDGYDDDVPEPSPRRGLRTIMVLAGLVILGAGGAFAYRSMLGGGSATTPPPVIKADTTPSKVVPAQNGEASNKLIYDRVGDASQGEKVVSREEQPVDIKDNSQPGPAASPRQIFPGLPVPAGQSSPAAMPSVASPPLAGTP